MRKVIIMVLTLLLIGLAIFETGCKKQQKLAEISPIILFRVTNSTASIRVIIVSDKDVTVLERGVLFGENENLDYDNGRITVGSGMGYFEYEFTGLEASTTYYVRAYALNGNGAISYSDVKVFSTLDENYGLGSYNGHDYVDLGLPSGTMWSTCNMGSDTPEGYGDYYAWGEISPKDIYSSSNYLYLDGNGLTKYCNMHEFGCNGFVDSLTVLQPADDAATVNWGSGWRIPTEEEWHELESYTVFSFVEQNGVNGICFTGENGRTLFLPASGFCYEGYENESAGGSGYYWSSTLDLFGPYCAYVFEFDWYGCMVIDLSRTWGRSIRPVCSSTQD